MAEPTHARRRWFQFGLRSIFVVVTASGIWLAMFVVPAKRQGRAIEALRQSGSWVSFDYQWTPETGYSSQAEKPGLPIFRWLLSDDYFQTVIGVRHDQGVLTTAELQPLKQLVSIRHLSLMSCGIDDEQMIDIVGQLQLLDKVLISMNNITDEGLVALEGMAKLRFLMISQNKINGRGLKHLLSLTELEELYLGRNPLTDEGLPHIAACANLTKLELCNTKITDAGVKHLTALKKLKYLGLSQTAVSPAAVEQLRTKLPTCEIKN